MANRDIKRCSISLAIEEMQLKSTMRYLLISVGMTVISKSSNNKCWREREHSFTTGGNVN